MTTLLLALLLQDPRVIVDPARETPGLRLLHGLRIVEGAFEFTHPLQVAELDVPRRFHDLPALTVAAWIFPRRVGEQAFVARGLPETGPGGERFFRPREDQVTFLLGSDPRGFFSAAVHGNGSMPFPYVTLHAPPVMRWSRLVAVKHVDGFQSFHANGTLMWSDREAAAAGGVRPFRDVVEGDPIRLMLPLGGRMGEVAIHGRGLSTDEVRADFEASRVRYAPALPATPVALREMDTHPTGARFDRARALEGMRRVFGDGPAERCPLEPRTHADEDCGSYVRRKVSIQVEAGDRMPMWLLVPKARHGRVPAIVCFYGTTSGAGKDTTVGLSGPNPGTPPAKNRAFAVDMVEAGFVALAPDWLRDGQRIAPGKRPYDTAGFYKRHPGWSIHGKDAFDTSRAIDWLQTLEFVDADLIGMVGHSYGGHSTIFAAARDERIKAAWANGPVSDFLLHGMHWAVPEGGGASQSLPAMRPYVLDPTLAPPVTFGEIMALVAPRALAVGQAVGERRPNDEEHAALVQSVYRSLGAGDRVRFVWYPGDHDFPPHVRREAVEWFRRTLR